MYNTAGVLLLRPQSNIGKYSGVPGDVREGGVTGTFTHYASSSEKFYLA